MRDHHGRSFRFPGMHVHGCFLRRPTRWRLDEAENIDNIVVLFLELALSEVWQQALIPALSVYDDDFLAPIARHFIGGLLQQFQLQVAAVSDGTGLMSRLENLTKIIFRIYDRILLLGRM